MAYYMIHCCPERLWYVKDFLLPSMLEQGIDGSHIFIYNDKNKIGNLRAWVDSCNRLAKLSDDKNIGHVWHLQDDVVISKNFKKVTEEYSIQPLAIICGFTCCYDDKPLVGIYELAEQKLWYSFPCIRLSTELTTKFAEWANVNLWQSKHFASAVRRNNCDDLIFKEWLYDNYEELHELNLSPNLVNHIDKWIGGSQCNKQRSDDQDTMSAFWIDNGELETLEKKLKDYKNKDKIPKEKIL